MKLNCHIRAANQFNRLAQRQISLALAVGFDRQTIIVAQNRCRNIAHILCNIRLTVAAVHRARVGVAVACGQHNNLAHKVVLLSLLSSLDYLVRLYRTAPAPCQTDNKKPEGFRSRAGLQTAYFTSIGQV